MRRIITAAALVSALSFGLAAAREVKPMPISELTAGADTIVLGLVESAKAAWKDGKIVTDVTIAPKETWKGMPKDHLVIEIPGGTVDGITMECGEAPRFTVGETAICFLRCSDAGICMFGWFRGKFTVLGSHIRESKTLTVSDLRAQVLSLVGRK